jgi:hypothetical protein
MSKSLSKKFCSWFCRIIIILIALPISFLAFVLAFYPLWCNEKPAIHRAKTLEEGEGLVTSIASIYVDSFNEGRLVHLTGQVLTDDVLTDETFNLYFYHTIAIKLRRTVEMYQWKESSYRDDEGDIHYTHKKVWSEHRIDSSRFLYKWLYKNPSMPVQGQSWIAEMKLGEFTLSSSFVAKMDHYQRLTITEQMFVEMPNTLYGRKLHLNNGNYYLGDNPDDPQIGDLRVKFEVVYPEAISVVAKQTDSHLSSYQTRVGGDIELFEYGTVDAETMFLHARIDNFANQLPHRILGFFIMFVAIYMAFFVLGRLEAFMPFLSGMVEWSRRGWISLAIVAATLSVFIIAVAWVKYTPILAIIVMVIAVSLLRLLKFARQLQEVPSIELLEPMLTHERVVPQKMNERNPIS